MGAPPRVLVVQNTRTGGPRRLGDWLSEDGLILDVVQPFNGQPLPERLDHDAVLIMGGGFMPDDVQRAPWLAPARTLAAQALESAVPFLGVCLGGQLLAQLAGGTVQADAGAPEHGSVQIHVRSEAHDDPLFHDLPPTVPAMENHVDAITAMPPGAVWLAATQRCPYQAFRLGESAWGVQFHPEAPPDRILHWDEGKFLRHGLDRSQLHQQAVADDAHAVRAWREVSRRFAQLVVR